MKNLVRTARKWCFSTVKLCLYEFNLAQDQIGSVPPKVDAEVKLLDKASTDIPESFWGFSKKEKALVDRFRRGEKCCAAYAGGEIVAYCWMAFGAVMVGEIQRLIKVGNDEVYLYDAYTAPKCRGYGLFSAILAETLQYLKYHGYRRALIFVLSDNTPSRKAISKAGFKQFSSVIYMRLFGVHIKLTARGEDPF